MIARTAPHLAGRTEEKSRKAYTGDTPITGEEWKQARNSFGYTQVIFGYYLSVHPNTVARRERDEQDFAHPRLARLAIAQHRTDIINGVINFDSSLIMGEEWRTYIDDLGMTPEQFGAAVDAHPITVLKWVKEAVEFLHPNMGRLAARRLYALKEIPFPFHKIK